MSGVLKSLSPLVHPLGLAWVALLIAFVVCVIRGRRLGAMISALAAALLWLVAQPPVVALLFARLERPWVENTIASAPRASAVVVLGGGWRTSDHDLAGIDFTPAADRWFTGVELCRLGRADVLVVGGDSTSPPEERPPASRALGRWLDLWQVTGAELRTLGPVASTRDEAVRAGELVRRMEWDRVLLVTSAFHMRRAMATFQRAGVPVHPVACDFQVIRGNRKPSSWRPYPDEEAFLLFNLWWHEMAGWLAYRAMGYL